jgi:hypothetical protein
MEAKTNKQTRKENRGRARKDRAGRRKGNQNH